MDHPVVSSQYHHSCSKIFQKLIGIVLNFLKVSELFRKILIIFLKNIIKIYSKFLRVVFKSRLLGIISSSFTKGIKIIQFSSFYFSNKTKFRISSNFFLISSKFYYPLYKFFWYFPHKFADLEFSQSSYNFWRIICDFINIETRLLRYFSFEFVNIVISNILQSENIHWYYQRNVEFFSTISCIIIVIIQFSEKSDYYFCLFKTFLPSSSPLKSLFVFIFLLSIVKG